MRARNIGLSQEMMAGARWSAKISRTLAGSIARHAKIRRC
jgi:hypothetical protein